MRNRSKFAFLQGIVLTSLLTAAVAIASSSASWQKDDPAHWTSEDVNQILNSSPWSKAVRVTVSRGSAYGDQGSGNRGGGTWGSGGQMPSDSSMGRGGMGRGGMGRGQNGGGYPSADEPTVTVLWESALPVRLAEAKLNGSPADPAALKALSEYVIAVIGLPKSGFRSPGSNSDDDSDDARLADHLKTITVLTIGHERLNPSKVELNQGRDARTVFHFDRSEPATVRDKDAEFRITTDRMDLRKKFALKDMEYQGKLEL